MERRAVARVEGQDFQAGVGGCLDRLEVPVADPGHGRQLVLAAGGALFLYPAEHEVGEGVGHEFGAEGLFVTGQDDLPDVPARARGQVDREYVAAVGAEADPAR